jgi:hypothetical protein
LITGTEYSIEGQMECPNCNVAVPAGAKFCINFGTRLLAECSDCQPSTAACIIFREASPRGLAAG